MRLESTHSPSQVLPTGLLPTLVYQHQCPLTHQLLPNALPPTLHINILSHCYQIQCFTLETLSCHSNKNSFNWSSFSHFRSKEVTSFYFHQISFMMACNRYDWEKSYLWHMKSNSKEKPVRKNVATYLLLVLEPAPGSARVVGQREGKLSSPVPEITRKFQPIL